MQRDDHSAQRVLFQKTLSIDSVYSPTADIGWQDTMEIALIVGGTGACHIFGRSVPCSEGEIFIIPAHIPHRFFVAESGSFLTIRTLSLRLADWMDGERADSGSPKYCYGVFSDGTFLAYAKLTQRTADEVNRLMDKISIECLGKRSGWIEAVKSYVSLLFITVSRYVESTIKRISDIPRTESVLISSLIGTVEEQIGEQELTLEALAASLYISPSYLSRLFRRYKGQSFSEFIKKYRISRACKLLDETDLTVPEIVAQCGLKDVPSFYKLFGKQTGMTPRQYRNRFKCNPIKENHISNHQKTGEEAMSILNEISANLQIGKAKIVKELVQQALNEGISAKTILEEGLISGMNVVGERFKNNEIYIPEVLIAARALNMGTEIIKPYFGEGGIQTLGRVCIGTVQGDLHDIGKNLVKMMMEGKQLEVIDLGTDVSPETFVKCAIENKCQVICCSALLTTTMGVMKDVVDACVAAGIRDQVKIMIGGAPVNEQFCQEIGADVYTVDAAAAADAALAICQEANA